MSGGPADAPAPKPLPPFGAILAGGESRRYGSPKALAEVAGVRIIDRVARALGDVAPDLVLLANEPELFRDLDLPTRPDVRPGMGVLGGIHTALLWALEEGRPGVLAVACDMPFPSVPLLAALRDRAFPDTAAGGATRTEGGRDAPDVVVPESRGRRGIEPLCAAYGVGCIPALEARLAEDDLRMIGFHDDVVVERIPLAEVETLCDPERAFLNVNTTEERDRAERLAAEVVRDADAEARP